MADEGQLDAQQILAFLADEAPAAASSSVATPKQVQAYREAAAVLDAVADPELLRPVGAEPVPGAVAEILGPDLVPATGSRFSGKVMLDPEIRADVLRDLVSSGRVKDVLEANKAERSGSLQAHLEKYLLHEPPPLEMQSLDELDETRQIAVWLEDVVPGVPTEDEVSRRAAYLRLLAPFETIAGDGVFRGRTKDLDDLRTYIGVVSPQSIVRKVQTLFRWNEPDRKPAVSIHGPGGVGKSALVARFMLEHTRLREDMRVPFAYLDFNRIALDVGDPIGLAQEMASQLAAQFPADGRFDKLAASYARIRSSPPESVEERIATARGFLADQLEMMSDMLGPRPYVVVLDTFEIVQYRGEARALPLWDMLVRLQERWPFLRVVISGRAPVDSLLLAGRPPRPIELAALDHDSALAFLETQGVADPVLRETLVKTFGGIPLSLKLVASLANRDKAVGHGRPLDPGGPSLVSMSEEVVQGYLFGRILDHVSNEQVRRVASPGLVLRRVNARIILEVLNEPCALGLTSIEDANSVFDELRRETSLVSVDDADGDLVHRQDLRQVMLKLLVTSAPAQVELIRRRAIDWYKVQSGRRAKAEEIYHRLHLGEWVDERELKDREVRSSVQAALVEFPVAIQRRLATIGFDVPPDVIERASSEVRDASLAAQIEERLPYGPTSEGMAWSMFESVAGDLRGPSPLYRAGARIAAQRGDDSAAESLIARGLEAALGDGSAELTLGLIQERVWLFRARPREEQEEGLASLADYAHRLKSHLATLQHRAQSFDASDHEIERRLITFGRLLAQTEPDDVWALTPALRPLVEAATSRGGGALLQSLLLVVLSGSSPFRFSVFADPLAQSVLHVVQTSVVDGDPKDFGKAFLQLIDAWPYRVLFVEPPYGRVGEQLTESTA